VFSSIRARLWLSYAALILAALCVVAIVLLVFLLRNPILYRQTYVRISSAQELLVNGSHTPARIDAIAEALAVRVVLVDSQGNLVEDSSPEAAPIRVGAALLNARAVSAVRDRSGRVWFVSKAQLQDGSWLLVAAPRPKLLPALSLMTDELLLPLIEGAVIGLLLALVLAYVVARWIGNPLQRLVSAAHSVSSDWPAAGGTATPSTPAAARGGPKEVRELSEAFQAMLARVHASQRSQRDFVANVSHELKTPLTAIQGFAQALLDNAVETPEARRQAAQVIHDEAGRLHRLALDLLDLARLDAGTADLRMAELNLRTLLQSVVDRFRPMADAQKVALSLTVSPGLPDVTGDADRLSQVFTNLLENALKFTPAGGRVLVEAAAAGNNIEVNVADTGAGIPAADQPHVFDRFFQADSSRSGGESHGADRARWYNHPPQRVGQGNNFHHLPATRQPPSGLKSARFPEYRSQMSPTVSIIVPCYNEEGTIGTLLQAILAQTYPPRDMEVVVADGMSTDGTRGVIHEFQKAHPELPIHVVENPGRTIPSSLNRGMRAAAGEYLIRMDAHSIPIPEYVERCLEDLRSGAGTNVGGVWDIRPGDPGWVAKGIAAAAGHPLGAGDAGYRLGAKAGAVDTVPFGAFRREVFEKLGGFDETLLTNEDYEFNLRIRLSGGIVWLDPRIASTYLARSNLRALGAQYWRYGYWKCKMLLRYPRSLRWRQALPPALVAGILGLCAAGGVWRPAAYVLAMVVGLYVVAVLGSALSMGARYGAALVPTAAMALITMHFAWGTGFLWSLATSFVRPRG
jgi:succinoglycan biosynthesis protein ExoA